jgi:outer membrane protein assembly factor BamB
MPGRIAVALVALALAALAAPPPARSAAVAFQANPAHTGDAGDVGLRLPLRRAWGVKLPGRLSFPVAADGRVFVVRHRPRLRSGTEVVAMSIATGRVLWRRDLGADTDTATLGYGAGRVVVARESYADYDEPSAVLALGAADGRVLWEQGGGMWAGNPPVVDAGAVYVKGMPGSGVSALRLSDGALLWRTPTDSGDDGAPAVDAGSVYVVQSGCPDVHRLRRSDGAEVWHPENGCHGAGGDTPVLYGGRLYTRTSVEQVPSSGDVYDAGGGAVVGRTPADLPPAFRGGIGVFPDRGDDPWDYVGHRLVARDLASNRVRWRFRGDGYLDSAPLIASGFVFVGSGSGRLYGLALRSGRRVWRASARSPIPAPGAGTAGLAAAEGTLFVPALGRLLAYR